MKVAEIMTPHVIKIHKDRKLSDALDLMEKHRISRLLVVNGDELVGIITERDILETLGSSKHTNLTTSRLHVTSAMSKDLITISQDADVREAVKLMLENNIKSLPVVEQGEIKGIVTITDLLKPLTKSDVPVKEIMNTPVITVSPRDRAVYARKLMLDNGISRLVVVEDFRVVGILTLRQLAKAFATFKKLAETKQSSRVRNMLVEDVMTQNVVTISVDSTAGEAAGIMLDRGFSGLPVMNQESLAGIVTKKDLIALHVGT